MGGGARQSRGDGARSLSARSIHPSLRSSHAASSGLFGKGFSKSASKAQRNFGDIPALFVFTWGNARVANTSAKADVAATVATPARISRRLDSFRMCSP
jgi:hypothetical protein